MSGRARKSTHDKARNHEFFAGRLPYAHSKTPQREAVGANSLFTVVSFDLVHECNQSNSDHDHFHEHYLPISRETPGISSPYWSRAGQPSSICPLWTRPQLRHPTFALCKQLPAGTTRVWGLSTEALQAPSAKLGKKMGTCPIRYRDFLRVLYILDTGKEK